MSDKKSNSRRSFLRHAGFGLSSPLLFAGEQTDSAATVRIPSIKDVVINGIELHVVKVNQRGDWYFIELKTNKKVSGLGECSHAFSKANSDDTALKAAVKDFFELVNGQSPFNIEKFRQRAFAKAGSKLTRTVFSGMEQALWDLTGKLLGVPVHSLLGGKVHDKLRAYANINRATNERDSNGRRPVESFQRNAELAVQSGFSALKLAPFDEMKPLNNSFPQQIEADIQHAVTCIEAVRQTIGNTIDLLIDVHSHLNVELAQQTAKQLEPSNLFWFEEPVDPDKYHKETKIIKDGIRQTLAGGEAIFGRAGYEELIHDQALSIIMPDVKHCGGLLELKYIAAMAEAAGNIRVAPHNPSGPVATASSIAICATIPNFSILEYAFGEVPWSRELVTPNEQFKNGFFEVSDLPGTGIELNYAFIKKHS